MKCWCVKPNQIPIFEINHFVTLYIEWNATDYGSSDFFPLGGRKKIEMTSNTAIYFGASNLEVWEIT